MSERLERIARDELKTVARSITLKWGYWNSSPLTTSYVGGNLLSAEELKEIERLTDLYRAARDAYDRGNYLACIEIATAEDEAA